MSGRASVHHNSDEPFPCTVAPRCHRHVPDWSWPLLMRVFISLRPRAMCMTHPHSPPSPHPIAALPCFRSLFTSRFCFPSFLLRIPIWFPLLFSVSMFPFDIMIFCLPFLFFSLFLSSLFLSFRARFPVLESCSFSLLDSAVLLSSLFLYSFLSTSCISLFPSYFLPPFPYLLILLLFNIL
jgi:hypothetical protein